MRERNQIDRLWFIEYYYSNLPIGARFSGPYRTREIARIQKKSVKGYPRCKIVGFGRLTEYDF